MAALALVSHVTMCRHADYFNSLNGLAVMVKLCAILNGKAPILLG